MTEPDQGASPRESPFSFEATNQERVRWIKRLRQRKGLREPINDFPFALFGVEDWPGLLEALRHARRLMPPWKSCDALYAAFGVSEYFYAPFPSDLFELPSVVARRSALAGTWGTSVRTLERLEDEGALVLDHFLREMENERYGLLLLERINEQFDALRWWLSQRDLTFPEEVWSDVKFASQERVHYAANLLAAGYETSAKTAAEHGAKAVEHPYS